jgi:very-short-patch-repair endonuclease
MTDASRICPNMSGKSESGGVDRVVAALANRQHGVAARRQLLDAGITRHEIDHRLMLGRLHALHHGVFAVGHRRLTREGRWMAAVLAAGPGAALSHRSAAALWGLRPSEYLDVTVPTYRKRPGIRIHTSSLPPDEITSLQAIPVTTVPRTLLDLASTLPPHQVERAANEAELRGRTDRLSLADLVARYPRRPGLPTIKSIIERLEAGTTVTRSELEARFLDLVRASGLPPTSPNTKVLGYECDFVWREQAVVVELDGAAVHRTLSAFHRDRERDRALQAQGWRVIRITWRDLDRNAEGLATDLRRILRAPALRP